MAHVAPKKGGKVRALKATFAVLCFGVGVAFVTGAIYGLVRPLDTRHDGRNAFARRLLAVTPEGSIWSSLSAARAYGSL